MFTFKQTLIYTSLVSMGLLLGVTGAPHADMTPMEEDNMRSISAREGIDLRFNLELGYEYNSTGENVHINIRDSDGFGGGTTRNLAILDLWLTLNVGASNSDAIAIDTVNTSPAVLQLSMGNNDTFGGFEAGIGSIYIRNSQTGTGGTVGLPGVRIGNGSGGAGTLDFDGNMQIWGADPP